MKNIITKASFIIVLLITLSCSTSKKAADNTLINPLTGGTAVRDGSIVYALPRSVFNVVVDLERTIEIPGPYRKYAGDLLGLGDVIQDEGEYWIIEGISIESREELDPSQFYVISSNTLFQTNMLSLKKEGLIMDLNPAIYFSNENRTGINKSEFNSFISADLGSDEYFQVQRDTAFKRVSLDSSFVRIPYIVEKRKKLTEEQLAERTAKRLMEMRDGKHLILTGEATVFPQNAAAINEMNRLEKEYIELFTGKTLKEKRTFTFQLIPSKEMAGKPFKLFQFSYLQGIIAENQSGGEPVTVELIPENKTRALTIINKPETNTGEKTYDKLYYRVPDVVNIKISTGSEVLLNSRRLIYQFGEVMQLPANYIIGK
jgi:hypothetical protein